MARSFVPLAVVGLLIGAVVPGNAQTTDPAALRAAIAKVGGRVIIALKPGTGTFLRARGTPAVSAAKMDVIEQRMMKQYRLRVQSRAEGDAWRCLRRSRIRMSCAFLPTQMSTTSSPIN